MIPKSGNRFSDKIMLQQIIRLDARRVNRLDSGRTGGCSLHRKANSGGGHDAVCGCASSCCLSGTASAAWLAQWALARPAAPDNRGRLPAGSAVDVIARLISQRLSTRSPAVIVENRAGASGVMLRYGRQGRARRIDARMAPPPPTCMRAVLNAKLPDDPVKEFAPRRGRRLALCGGRPSKSRDNVAELVALAKASRDADYSRSERQASASCGNCSPPWPASS